MCWTNCSRSRGVGNALAGPEAGVVLQVLFGNPVPFLALHRQVRDPRRPVGRVAGDTRDGCEGQEVVGSVDDADDEPLEYVCDCLAIVRLGQVNADVGHDGVQPMDSVSGI